MDTTKIRNKLGIINDYLSKKYEGLERKLQEACRRCESSAAAAILPKLLEISSVRQVSEDALADVGTESEVPVYMLSTIFVQDTFNTLTQGPEEDLRFATGLNVAPKTYAITRLLQFKLSLKSVISAEGDPASVNRVLIYLHNHDHKLYMTWHSHPGIGKGSTTPSSIDRDFHRRLELGNYPVIGAVCGRQGYVRFYSYKRPFKIVIHGKGMELIDEKQSLFKLNSIGTI